MFQIFEFQDKVTTLRLQESFKRKKFSGQSNRSFKKHAYFNGFIPDLWYLRNNKFWWWWWCKLFLIRVTQQIFKQTKIEQIISVFVHLTFLCSCVLNKSCTKHGNQTSKLSHSHSKQPVFFYFEQNVFTYSKIVLERFFFFKKIKL